MTGDARHLNLVQDGIARRVTAFRPGLVTVERLPHAPRRAAAGLEAVRGSLGIEVAVIIEDVATDASGRHVLSFRPSDGDDRVLQHLADWFAGEDLVPEALLVSGSSETAGRPAPRPAMLVGLATAALGAVWLASVRGSEAADVLYRVLMME